MIETLNAAMAQYWTAWSTLIAERSDREFFEALYPTAVAWKTEDEAEYRRLLDDLRGFCDIVVENRWDDRWIAMVHLKDAKLTQDVEVVKLMQRRPGSTDSVGLDHIDFYSPNVVHADQMLAKETDLVWTHETGGPCKWISVWFADTEAKLRTHTVIDSCIRDLSAYNEHITRQ